MRMQLSILPETAQLRAVRRVLEGCAAAHNVAAETLTLIATELVANAISVTPAGQRIDLSVELSDEAVALTVADPGPAEFDGSDSGPVGPESLRGRGLHIVHSLSNRLTIERVDGRTVITAHQYRRMLGPLPEQGANGHAANGHDGAVASNGRSTPRSDAEPSR
jgi:anti-sigma regulatory factor (Ser/Thr protein kinase)